MIISKRSLREENTHYLFYENKWFFIWTNLNPLHPRMHYANLAQRFWRRTFLNFANVFLLFRNFLPLEKVWALDFNKLESSFTQILVEIGLAVLEEKKIF